MNRPDGISCQKCLTSAKFNCEISGWALIEYIIFCHILWWIFYYLLLLLTKQSAEWCCRFVTLIHGCLVSYAAITDIYARGPNINFGNNTLSEAQKIYLSYMLSYFLFDFCWMHIFGNETWIIYVHHITSIVIIINVLTRSYGGDGVSYGVAGLEFTNPYLQLRWFLRTHGYLNKPIHTITELWFVFLFFIIRMIGGTILLYRCVSNKQVDYAMKLSFLAIYGISLVLQWQIFVFIRKKYFTTEGRGSLSLPTRDSMSPYFQRRTWDSIDEQMISYRTEDVVEEAPPNRKRTIVRPAETSNARSTTDDTRDDAKQEAPVKVTKHVTVEFVLSESAGSKSRMVGAATPDGGIQPDSSKAAKAASADFDAAEEETAGEENQEDRPSRSRAVTYNNELENRIPERESRFKSLRKKTLKLFLRKKTEDGESQVPRDE